jgi:ABC-2 type transport system permease protein
MEQILAPMSNLSPNSPSNLTSPNGTRSPASSWTARQTQSQFAAIAWLRWRITVNGMRRKGATGELVARILIYPVLAAMAFGPTVLAGVGGFYFASSGHLDRIAWLLWGTFALCQLLNIQVGQPGTTFDPTQLIRFPVGLGSYTAIRLFFGLLTPANVIGTMIAFAIAVGVVLALPALWFYALLGLAVFASANVLFSRMVFAWVDRWLATRRAREIFTALIFTGSLGIQWLNFTYNPAYNHRRHYGEYGQSFPAERLTSIGHIYQRALPFLHVLPPELTASSLVAARGGHVAGFFGLTLACALFSAAFLAVFMLRMRKEFRGENLSDAANAVGRKAKTVAGVKPGAGDLSTTRLQSPSAALESLPTAQTLAHGNFQISPIVLAILGKEFLYVRRNTGIFYSLIAPVVFVFLFAGRLATRTGGEWIFPAALAYTMLGITPLSYNSFGLEGTGSQFYFLAPVHLREVFLAKNLMNFSLAFLEAAAVFCIIAYVAAVPSLQTTVIAILWAAATLLLSTALGNRRSISAPKQIKTARGAGKQASPLSTLIGMAILLSSALLASIALGLGIYFQKQWVLMPVFAAFFAAAVWVYVRSLGGLERHALDHREELFTELCKKA